MDCPHHDPVLLRGVRHLHSAGSPDCWVRHITVTTNLIGGVHNDLGDNLSCQQIFRI